MTGAAFASGNVKALENIVLTKLESLRKSAHLIVKIPWRWFISLAPVGRGELNRLAGTPPPSCWNIRSI